MKRTTLPLIALFICLNSASALEVQGLSLFMYANKIKAA